LSRPDYFVPDGQLSSLADVVGPRPGCAAPGSEGEMAMTWEELRGNWHFLRVKVQQQWDRLSNEDTDFIQGRRAELVEKLRERYGFTEDEAEKEIEQWRARLNGVNA
jgi:uncharacterized protein YjbJ (UPF0337 family)